jgi:hypothetical protein
VALSKLEAAAAATTTRNQYHKSVAGVHTCCCRRQTLKSFFFFNLNRDTTWQNTFPSSAEINSFLLLFLIKFLILSNSAKLHGGTF